MKSCRMFNTMVRSHCMFNTKVAHHTMRVNCVVGCIFALLGSAPPQETSTCRHADQKSEKRMTSRE